MNSPTNVAVLIPAYHVTPWEAGFARRLESGFEAVRDAFGAQVVLVFVDDGSQAPGTAVDDHAPGLRALNVPTVRARHPLNRGQGAALQTALHLARCAAVDAHYFVTMDADGQHDPADLVSLLRPVISGDAHIAFGNRFDPETIARSGIPSSRRLLLRAAAVFDHLITGLRLGDAHNGLRAFDRKTADVIDLRQDRMAHATEFKQIVARHDLRYCEVPVRITYTDATLARGQGNLNAVNIVRELARSWWME